MGTGTSSSCQHIKQAPPPPDPPPRPPLGARVAHLRRLHRGTLLARPGESHTCQSFPFVTLAILSYLSHFPMFSHLSHSPFSPIFSHFSHATFFFSGGSHLRHQLHALRRLRPPRRHTHHREHCTHLVWKDLHAVLRAARRQQALLRSRGGMGCDVGEIG